MPKRPRAAVAARLDVLEGELAVHVESERERAHTHTAKDDELFVIDKEAKAEGSTTHTRKRIPGIKYYRAEPKRAADAVVSAVEERLIARVRARGCAHTDGGDAKAVNEVKVVGRRRQDDDDTAIPAASLASRVSSVWGDEPAAPRPARGRGMGTGRTQARGGGLVQAGAKDAWSVNPSVEAHQDALAEALAEELAAARKERLVAEALAPAADVEAYLATTRDPDDDDGQEARSTPSGSAVAADSVGVSAGDHPIVLRASDDAEDAQDIVLAPSAAFRRRRVRPIVPLSDELTGSLRTTPATDVGSLATETLADLVQRGAAGERRKKHARANPYRELQFPRPSTLVERYRDDPRPAFAKAVLADAE